MKTVRHLVSVRNLLLVVLVSLGYAASVYSLPPVGHDTTYYSGGDAVGGRYLGCDGYRDIWGVQTPVFDHYEWSCGSWGWDCYQAGQVITNPTECWYSIDTCNYMADYIGHCPWSENLQCERVAGVSSSSGGSSR